LLLLELFLLCLLLLLSLLLLLLLELLLLLVWLLTVLQEHIHHGHTQCCGSTPLTNGSESGCGSFYFHH
jgi:hypothetical protein